MTENDIKKRIIKIINKMDYGEKITEIDENENLLNQIKFDSMDLLDLLIKIRKEFNIIIEQDDFEHFSKLKTAVEFIKNKQSN